MQGVQACLEYRQSVTAWKNHGNLVANSVHFLTGVVVSVRSMAPPVVARRPCCQPLRAGRRVVPDCRQATQTFWYVHARSICDTAVESLMTIVDSRAISVALPGSDADLPEAGPPSHCFAAI